jgi:hypothetical protein
LIDELEVERNKIDIVIPHLRALLDHLSPTGAAVPPSADLWHTPGPAVATRQPAPMAIPPREPGKRREYTDEQKEILLAEIDRHGVKATARRYDITESVLHRMKRMDTRPKPPAVVQALRQAMETVQRQDAAWEERRRKAAGQAM